MASDETAGLLFDRYAGAVYSYCFRRTADAALAEDLTSIVFLETWRRRRDVELDVEHALPWLLGVATNVLRNQRRALRRYRAALARLPRAGTTPDFADELADRVDAERQMRDLLAAIAHLPLVEQEALALCAWEGLSAAAAARVLGVPEPTVRTRLFRARARLRTQADLTEVNAT